MRNFERFCLAAALLLASSGAIAAATDEAAVAIPAGGPAAALAGTDLLQDETPLDALAPGEFEWQPGWERQNGAPVMVMVSLKDQRAYVYRDGQRIGTSTVSTGSPGRETPTGVFEILQKQKMHHSNLYDDAPMPWMQRLTWSGVAMHAGRIPGRPASHGCVRLPAEFAKQLYSITADGGTVVISEDGSLDALARAGVDTQLAMLIGASTSLDEMADVLVRDDEPQREEGASGNQDGALSP